MCAKALWRPGVRAHAAPPRRLPSCEWLYSSTAATAAMAAASARPVLTETALLGFR